MSTGKSFKKCELDALARQPSVRETMWRFVDCESVNTHFWRNFITNSEEEDVQLEINGDPLSYKIVGF